MFEAKILQLDHRPLLRSRGPDGVMQEIYGLLIARQYLQAQRARAAQASLDPTTGRPLDPDRISFTAVLRTPTVTCTTGRPRDSPPLITLVQTEALAQLIPRGPHRIRPRARQAPNHRVRPPDQCPSATSPTRSPSAAETRLPASHPNHPPNSDATLRLEHPRCDAPVRRWRPPRESPGGCALLSRGRLPSYASGSRTDSRRAALRDASSAWGDHPCTGSRSSVRPGAGQVAPHAGSGP